ncbi:MAG TPA: outer membrane beta-barrel protein, partial [Flavitalea sp.]|nr:outer membrane beta-barrel protein [Flavitalea sp.]
NQHKPVMNVNVLVLMPNDSSLVKGTVTDQAGKFMLENIQSGNYLLAASYVGFRTHYHSCTIEEHTRTLPLPLIVLSRESAELGKVEVAAKRPFIEQRIDRMIVNVSNSIVSSGSTALEILRKAPGVVVDMQNDLLSLRGKQGVIVQIDGKQTYLPAEQVVAMLRNMPGSNIDRIEVITNPSAKYDAGGDAGIIDIRLKKNKNLGTNGSVSVSAGSGKYGRERGSLQINHKTSRLNLFGNYAVNRGGDYFNFDLQRKFIVGSEYYYANQVSPIRFRNHGHNAKAGADFQLSPATTIGLVWTGFWVQRNEVSLGETFFRHDPQENPYSHTITDKTISNGTSNQLGNFYIQHKLKNNLGQVSVDLNAGQFNRDFHNSLNSIISNSGMPDIMAGLLSVMPSEINIYTATADYSRTYQNGWTLQAGWKSSLVKSANDMKLSQGENGNLDLDTSLSSNFIYKERIHALYVSINGKINSKTELQAGLRAEQTVSDANSLTQKKQIKRDYLNFFPSIFLTRKLKKENSLTLSYSYRINRPNYQNLNPVRSYLDPFAYSKGNSFLKPEYTHSLEVKHGYKDRIFTSLGAAYTKDLMFFTLSPVTTKITERTPENIGKSALYNLTVTGPIGVLKGWSMQWTVLGTYGNYQYTFLNTFFKTTQFSGRLDLSNSFDFGKGWTGELSGWVTTPSKEAQRQNPWLASGDLGVQKTIKSDWKIKFSLSDFTHTDWVNAKINTPQLTNKVVIKFDSRVALLSVTYNFGNQQIKNRQRKSSSEDELKRTN